MKTKCFLLFLFTLCFSFLFSQYKYDNSIYKNIYVEDLCKQLEEHPKHLLLDVRSPGEYADTSSYTNLNIGRLKDAVNINIRELDKRWKELLPYKNEPVYIYCSHSQRSRRASKMLADSGFTNIINVNGGMTNYNLQKNISALCSSSLYQTSNTYQLVSPLNLVALLNTEKNIFLLDIRKDSAFKGISAFEEQNAFGRIKGAMNIPLSEVENNLGKIPADKKIIVIDSYGDESPAVATKLAGKGYKDVMILFNGMALWTGVGNIASKEKYWEHSKTYHLLTAEEFDKQFKNNKDFLLLDVRTNDEFNNKAKDTWRNKGNLAGAVNIPFGELMNRLKELDSYKNKSVVIYDFSGQNEAFSAAKTLALSGFKNVYLMMDGIWDLRWKAANIKGLDYLNKWVVNVPTENL